MQHDRNDRGQGQHGGPIFCLCHMPLEDVHDVAEQAQNHELVGLALMFEQKVEKSGAPGDLRAK